MNRYFFILLLFLFCVGGIGYAQDQGGILKRSVEINKNIKTKSGYNQFLIDMVRDIDVAYSDYEDVVQKVWDHEIEMDLLKSSKSTLKKLSEYKELIKTIPAFLGGDDYQRAVLDYAEAVELKTECLEKYGVLGADAHSDITEYKKIEKEFNEIVNDAIDKRNIVRKKKDEFEKTTYMKNKRKK